VKPTVVITVETMVIHHTVVTWVSQNNGVITKAGQNIVVEDPAFIEDIVATILVNWMGHIEVVTTVQSNHGVGSFVKESFLSLFE